MSSEESRTSRVLSDAAAVGSAAAGGLTRRLTRLLGGEERTRVILILAAVLGLSGADVATVGASASELRSGLHITNTDIGLLVSVSSLVGAVATLPFGVLADRATRTRILGGTILLWGVEHWYMRRERHQDEVWWDQMLLFFPLASTGEPVRASAGDPRA